jgi:hypothetical protein
MRDPDGYTVVVASPYGTADGTWRPDQNPFGQLSQHQPHSNSTYFATPALLGLPVLPTARTQLVNAAPSQADGRLLFSPATPDATSFTPFDMIEDRLEPPEASTWQGRRSRYAFSSGSKLTLHGRQSVWKRAFSHSKWATTTHTSARRNRKGEPPPPLIRVAFHSVTDSLPTHSKRRAELVPQPVAIKFPLVASNISRLMVSVNSSASLSSSMARVSLCVCIHTPAGLKTKDSVTAA